MPRKTRISPLAPPFTDYVVIGVPLVRPACFAALTQAELAVAEGLLEGTSIEEIARSRGVSARTVGNQAERIYRKLGIVSRFELVALVASPRSR